MYTNMHTHTYTRTRTYTYLYTHAHIHIHIHSVAHTDAHTHKCTCTQLKNVLHVQGTFQIQVFPQRHETTHILCIINMHGYISACVCLVLSLSVWMCVFGVGGGIQQQSVEKMRADSSSDSIIFPSSHSSTCSPVALVFTSSPTLPPAHLFPPSLPPPPPSALPPCFCSFWYMDCWIGTSWSSHFHMHTYNL